MSEIYTKLVQELQRYWGVGGEHKEGSSQSTSISKILTWVYFSCVASLVSKVCLCRSPFRQRLLFAPPLCKLMAAVQGLHQMGTITLLFIWIPNCPILQEKSCKGWSICLKVYVWLVYFCVDKWHFNHSSGFISLVPNKNQRQTSVLLLQTQPTLKVWRYMSSFPMSCWGLNWPFWAYFSLVLKWWCDSTGGEPGHSDSERKKLLLCSPFVKVASLESLTC